MSRPRWLALALVPKPQSSSRYHTVALQLHQSSIRREPREGFRSTTARFSSDWQKPSTSLSASPLNNNNDPTSSILGSVKEQYCRSRLLFLKDEMVQLAGDKDFNANSPSQRSLALFGEVRSCTKETLQDIADGQGLSNDKKLLAQYILEFQELLKLSGESPKTPQVETPITDSAFDPTETPAKQKPSSAALSMAPTPETTTNDTISEPKEPKQTKQSTSKPEPIVTTPPAVQTRANTESGRRPPRQRPITYEEIVEGIFDKPSKMDSYWKEPLLELSRPVARDLAKQLDPQICPMGYDPDYGQKAKQPTRGKRVGFLGYCRDQKELYPNHVVLVRCGDFYETFGVDALLLVEHVGLNPMGGKARSGCPKQNIQPTLDGLTLQGFSVAVYEELEPVGTSSTKKTQNEVFGTDCLSRLAYLSIRQLVAGR